MLQPARAHVSDIDPRSDEFVQAFGNFLIEDKSLDELAVRRAQRAVSQSGERFDVVLNRLGLLSDSLIAKALAGFCGLRFVVPEEFPEAALFADKLQFTFLKTNRILPVAESAERIEVAVADPFNRDALAALAFLFDRPISCGIAPEGDIDRAIAQLYGNGIAKTDAVGRSEPLAAEQASEDDERHQTEKPHRHGLEPSPHEAANGLLLQSGGRLL